jgi:hypothetical protein
VAARTNRGDRRDGGLWRRGSMVGRRDGGDGIVPARTEKEDRRDVELRRRGSVVGRRYAGGTGEEVGDGMPTATLFDGEALAAVVASSERLSQTDLAEDEGGDGGVLRCENMLRARLFEREGSVVVGGSTAVLFQPEGAVKHREDAIALLGDAMRRASLIGGDVSMACAEAVAAPVDGKFKAGFEVYFEAASPVKSFRKSRTLTRSSSRCLICLSIDSRLCMPAVTHGCVGAGSAMPVFSSSAGMLAYEEVRSLCS